MGNVCGIDRVLRIVGGVILLLLTFFGPFTELLYPWGLLGAVPLITGMIGWCPAYSLFGFRSCTLGH
jgi:hypothetical protein